MKKIIILLTVLTSTALIGCNGDGDSATREFTTPDPVEIDTDPSAPENFPEI